jgi:SAM-dependent methyltransferase
MARRREGSGPTMRLVDVEFEAADVVLPDDVAQLIAEAQRRIEQMEEEFRAAIPAFVPSDFDAVYRALAHIQTARISTGQRFLEWGSGVGAVTCLAAKLGFDAVGIEVEPPLVEMAEELAERFAVAAQFVCGSFVPSGAEAHVDAAGEVAWLRTDAEDGYRELELDPDDFDVIFAYPWPGEEQVIFDLFHECAAVGTLLLTYHSQDGLRLQRKVRR